MVVQMKLTDAAFEAPLRCDHSFSVNIHIKPLCNVLRRASSNDKLHIYSSTTDPDTLQLTFINERGSRYSTFTLALIDNDTCPTIPDIEDEEYTVRMMMPTVSFRRALEHTTDFGDNVSITASGNSVKFVAISQLGNSEVNICNDDKNTSIVITQSISISYFSKYLLGIARAELAKMCTVSFDKTYPLRIEYKFEDNKGHFHCYIAPMLDGSDIDDWH